MTLESFRAVKDNPIGMSETGNLNLTSALGRYLGRYSMYDKITCSSTSTPQYYVAVLLFNFTLLLCFVSRIAIAQVWESSILPHRMANGVGIKEGRVEACAGLGQKSEFRTQPMWGQEDG